MTTNENLHQIGLPIDRLSNVLLNWTCYEPHRPIFITPSSKTEGWAIVETRDTELAAAILKDVPEARLRELEKPVVQINL